MLERICVDLGIGTVLIPIFFIVTTTIGIRLNTTAVWIILGAFLVLLCYKFLKSGLYKKLIQKPVKILNPETLVVLIILFIAIASRFYPLMGYYVYNGDDVRVYSLIAKRITEEGAITWSYGPYVQENWNPAADAHLVFSGSECIGAFYYFMFPVISVPQIMSLATLTYNAFTALSMYFFSKKLLGDRYRYLALLSMFILALINPYPYFFLHWGGIDETVGWFMLPITLLLLIQYNREISQPLLVVITMFMSGLIFIHPLTVAYVGCFLLPLLVLKIFKEKRKALKFVSRIGIAIAIALIITSPILIPGLIGLAKLSEIAPAGIWGWEGFEFAPIIKRNDPIGSIIQMFLLSTYYPYTAVVVVLGLIGLTILIQRDRVEGVYIIGWLLALFLINENSPFGLYSIGFPLWHYLFPERFAFMMCIPLSICGAYLLYRGLKDKTDKIGPVILVMIVLLPIFLYNVYVTANSTYWANAMTPRDIKAFSWIKNNIPINTTILINNADAGSWIPTFTGRRVFGFREVISNPTVRRDFEELNTLMYSDPNSQQAMNLMKKYNVEYVYFGEKVAYSRVKGDIGLFLSPPNITRYLVFWDGNISIHGSQIALFHNDDSITLAGPLLVNLTIYHDLQLEENRLIAIRINETWSYTLHEWISEYWGDWDAYIQLPPLYEILYNDHDVFILKVTCLELI